MKELRSIASGKRRDSMFVLKCMAFLYPDKNVLNNISVTGKTFKGLAKDKMPEDYSKFLKRMLNERLASEETDEVLILLRLGNQAKKPINKPTLQTQPHLLVKNET